MTPYTNPEMPIKLIARNGNFSLLALGLEEAWVESRLQKEKGEGQYIVLQQIVKDFFTQLEICS